MTDRPEETLPPLIDLVWPEIEDVFAIDELTRKWIPAGWLDGCVVMNVIQISPYSDWLLCRSHIFFFFFASKLANMADMHTINSFIIAVRVQRRHARRLDASELDVVY